MQMTSASKCTKSDMHDKSTEMRKITEIIIHSYFLADL